MTYIDDKAAEFAEKHGSFSLHFNADENMSSPDAHPWSLELHGYKTEWGGFTAEEVIDFASADMSKS